MAPGGAIFITIQVLKSDLPSAIRRCIRRRGGLAGAAGAFAGRFGGGFARATRTTFRGRGFLWRGLGGGFPRASRGLFAGGLLRRGLLSSGFFRGGLGGGFLRPSRGFFRGFGGGFLGRCLFRPGFFRAGFFAPAFFAPAFFAPVFAVAVLAAAFLGRPAAFFAVLRVPARTAKAWADGCSRFVSSVLTSDNSLAWLVLDSRTPA